MTCAGTKHTIVSIELVNRDAIAAHLKVLEVLRQDPATIMVRATVTGSALKFFADQANT